MFQTTTHQAELFLGDTHYEPRMWAHVFADVRIEQMVPSLLDLDSTMQTVDHRRIRAVEQVAVSFSLIRRGRGFDPLTMGPGMASDNAWISGGQTPTADRRIHQASSSPISREHRRLIQQTWEHSHLNGMNAGCVHMDDMVVPAVHDMKDDSSFKLAHWYCPVTGYRWGREWLVRELPADQLAELKTILTPTGKTIADFEARLEVQPTV
jgi:hypothetical protein